MNDLPKDLREEDEVTDDTLRLRVCNGESSSGVGGVGVRRNCLRIVPGAMCSASRCRKP